MAESIVTAAPRPPAAPWRRWSFRAAARCTSRATTSPTKKAAEDRKNKVSIAMVMGRVLDAWPCAIWLNPKAENLWG